MGAQCKCVDRRVGGRRGGLGGGVMLLWAEEGISICER